MTMISNDRGGGCGVLLRPDRLTSKDVGFGAADLLWDAPEQGLGATEDEMPTNLVNLDALIPREDFEVVDDAAEWRTIDTVQIRDLEPKTFFYVALRKPDFQRETAGWSPKKIADFVKTFLDGDLVPAVILWRSGKSTFVIDGSHRLSALIAWVQDDYGDGKASRDFFQNLIPKEQKLAADRTRKLIQREIGTYIEHLSAAEHPERSRPAVLARAKRLGSLAMQLQWVTGDAKKAEASFFKINQEATPIDKTELQILKARNSPNALAARAILRSGTGHKYWSKFSSLTQEEIERISRDVYKILFEPPLDMPIKTLDIPVAGRGYSGQALPLTFDLVNLANDVKVLDLTKASASAAPGPKDENGEKTIQFLKNTRRIMYRISGLHPSSLGLHPALYFYSSSGRYQPTAFLAVVSLMKHFENGNLFNEFTRVRRHFEDFLAAYKGIPNSVVSKRGSGAKGFDLLKRIYVAIFDSLRSGKTTNEEVATALSEDEHIRRYVMDAMEADDDGQVRRDFDSTVKSAIFLREAMDAPLRCRICGGLIHYNSITIDHVIRKADGGLAVKDNGQLAHPYCNTTYKN